MISKVKGGFQVREMVKSSTVALRSPTAERGPYKYVIRMCVCALLAYMDGLNCSHKNYYHKFCTNNYLCESVLETHLDASSSLGCFCELLCKCF